MTAFIIKIIACVAMLIDHTGSVFSSELTAISPWLYDCARIIGRLAFPLFAFGIAEGVVHTSSVKKYILRMALWALIAQLPFMLMVGISVPSAVINLFGYGIPIATSCSVMTTLLLGLICCAAIHEKKPLYAVFALGAALLLDVTIGMDYGLFGVLFVMALYFSRGYKWGRMLVMLLMLFFAVIFYWSSISSIVLNISRGVLNDRMLALILRPVFMFLATIPMLLYNGRQGFKSRLLLYSFYPAHMLLLWLIWAFIKLF